MICLKNLARAVPRVARFFWVQQTKSVPKLSHKYQKAITIYEKPMRHAKIFNPKAFKKALKLPILV
jgi:hypothetical protein